MAVDAQPPSRAGAWLGSSAFLRCAAGPGHAGDDRIRPSMGATFGPGAGIAGLNLPISIPDPSVHRTRQYPGLGGQDPARRDAAGQPAASVGFRLPGVIYLVGGADAAVGIAGGERSDAIQGGGFSGAEVAVDVAGQTRQTAGSGLAAAAAGIESVQCPVR